MPAINDKETRRSLSQPDSLIRSKSGALIAAMTFANLATGLLQICMPLELRQLRASPNEIGVTLSMFGFGMFAFEWLWGILADRAGYRAPLVVSQVLYAACILLLSRVDSIVLIAASYFLASGMMVAIGPNRPVIPGHRAAEPAACDRAGTACSVVGARRSGRRGSGWAADRPCPDSQRDPGRCGSAAWVGPARDLGLQGLLPRDHHGPWTADDEARSEESRAGGGVLRILAVTASLVLLIQVGAGGEFALLPLLVTTHLHLSAASAGTRCSPSGCSVGCS